MSTEPRWNRVGVRDPLPLPLRVRSKSCAGELDATDAVGDGVVEAERERGPAAGETVDDRQLPQGAGDVERRGHRGLDDTKHGPDVGRIGNPDAPKVEVERGVVARDPVGAAQKAAAR